MKKRALKGIERANVQKELLHKKTILWRREKTKEMDYGDPERVIYILMMY